MGLLINTQPEEGEEGGALPHERVTFKFIENNFEKLQRLFELHLKYFQPIEDFDLSKFDSAEDIEYLVSDYRFDILEQVDALIGFLLESETAEKLSEGDLIRNKINEFMKFNGIKKE